MAYRVRRLDGYCIIGKSLRKHANRMVSCQLQLCVILALLGTKHLRDKAHTPDSIVSAAAFRALTALLHHVGSRCSTPTITPSVAEPSSMAMCSKLRSIDHDAFNQLVNVRRAVTDGLRNRDQWASICQNKMRCNTQTAPPRENSPIARCNKLLIFCLRLYFRPRLSRTSARVSDNSSLLTSSVNGTPAGLYFWMSFSNEARDAAM